MPTTDENSGERLRLRQRVIKSALWSASLVALWILAHLARDRCWFVIEGASYVITSSTLLFIWLWLFLAFTWAGRIALVIVALAILAIMPLGDRHKVAAAEAQAASVLRTTAAKLGEYQAGSQSTSYPATLAIEIHGDVDRYYRFEYVPLRSRPEAPVDSFLLKATPRWYGCGSFASFTVGKDGKFHMTQDNREATIADPVLN